MTDHKDEARVALSRIVAAAKLSNSTYSRTKLAADEKLAREYFDARTSAPADLPDKLIPILEEVKAQRKAPKVTAKDAEFLIRALVKGASGGKLSKGASLLSILIKLQQIRKLK
jgi:hypothetical protein